MFYSWNSCIWLCTRVGSSVAIHQSTCKLLPPLPIVLHYILMVKSNLLYYTIYWWSNPTCCTTLYTDGQIQPAVLHYILMVKSNLLYYTIYWWSNPTCCHLHQTHRSCRNFASFFSEKIKKIRDNTAEVTAAESLVMPLCAPEKRSLALRVQGRLAYEKIYLMDLLHFCRACSLCLLQMFPKEFRCEH